MNDKAIKAFWKLVQYSVLYSPKTLSGNYLSRLSKEDRTALSTLSAEDLNKLRIGDRPPKQNRKSRIRKIK